MKNLCFLLNILVAQFLGAFSGIGFAYLVRTTIPLEGDEYKTVYIPSQNPFYPKILDKVGTVPAYGQVLLAETMGSLVYILVQLHVQH